MPDEVKLLPCRHCGWSSGIEFSEAASAVICPDCLARGPVEDTEAEAIAAWNTRAIEATDEVVERVARALCRVVDGREDDWPDYDTEARAAIAAQQVDHD